MRRRQPREHGQFDVELGLRRYPSIIGAGLLRQAALYGEATQRPLRLITDEYVAAHYPLVVRETPRLGDTQLVLLAGEGPRRWRASNASWTGCWRRGCRATAGWSRLAARGHDPAGFARRSTSAASIIQILTTLAQVDFGRRKTAPITRAART